jgi:S1-C subfamily serine protease
MTSSQFSNARNPWIWVLASAGFLLGVLLTIVVPRLGGNDGDGAGDGVGLAEHNLRERDSMPPPDPTLGGESGTVVTTTRGQSPKTIGRRSITERGALDVDELKTIELFRRSSGSVVHIQTNVRVLNRLTMNATDVPQGSGTGFIWDTDGHVITNYHVIADADSATVTLADQSSYPAQLVDRSPQKDLAVLKIDAPKEKLRPIALGTSADLQVGQNVYAIGNPFGLDQTLTTGVISGLGRQIESRTGQNIEGVIQTDAPINPGNSGGPLLDSSGRLIGVNTAIYSTSGAYAGIGFAIPVDTIGHVVSQLLGDIPRPAIGITLGPESIMRELRIQGVLVLRVSEGGMAEMGGIQPTKIDGENTILGDVIIKADDMRIRNNSDLMAYLDSKTVGDETTLTVIRGLGTRSPKEVTVRGRLQARTGEE